MKYLKNEDGGDNRRQMELPPPGEYAVQVHNCDEVISKAGNPMLKIAAVIKGGDYDGTWMWEYITESAAWKLEQFSKAVKVPLPASGDYINALDYIGAKGKVKVKHDNGGDSARLKIERWIDPAAKPKRDKGQVWARKRAIEKSQPAPEPSDDEIDNEEVPF